MTQYQLNLKAFVIPIQDCFSPSGGLLTYCAAFPSNVQRHAFRQILCYFCSSQILFYHCSGVRVYKPSSRHTDRVYSAKLMTVLLLSSHCASETTVFRGQPYTLGQQTQDVTLGRALRWIRLSFCPPNCML